MVAAVPKREDPRAAGIKRLGLLDDDIQILEPDVFPYAVGQGALVVQARCESTGLIELVATIEDRAARAEVDAERSLLHELGSGCSLPIGVVTTWHNKGQTLRLKAVITAADGSRTITAEHKDTKQLATQLGKEVATMLYKQGAADLLSSAN